MLHVFVYSFSGIDVPFFLWFQKLILVGSWAHFVPPFQVCQLLPVCHKWHTCSFWKRQVSSTEALTPMDPQLTTQHALLIVGMPNSFSYLNPTCMDSFWFPCKISCIRDKCVLDLPFLMVSASPIQLCSWFPLWFCKAKMFCWIPPPELKLRQRFPKGKLCKRTCPVWWNGLWLSKGWKCLSHAERLAVRLGSCGPSYVETTLRKNWNWTSSWAVAFCEPPNFREARPPKPSTHPQVKHARPAKKPE